MQITHHRGDILSPAGHKARPLFTSADSDEYRACAALLRGSERRYSRGAVWGNRSISKAPYVGPAMRGQPHSSITALSMSDPGSREEPKLEAAKASEHRLGWCVQTLRTLLALFLLTE